MVEATGQRLANFVLVKAGDGIFFSGREGETIFRAGDATALLSGVQSADDRARTRSSCVVLRYR